MGRISAAVGCCAVTAILAASAPRPAQPNTALEPPKLRIVYASGGEINPRYNLGSLPDFVDPSHRFFRSYQLRQAVSGSPRPATLPLPGIAGESTDALWRFPSAGWSPDGRWLAISNGIASIGAGDVLVLRSDGRRFADVNRGYAGTPVGLWSTDRDKLSTMRFLAVRDHKRLVPALSAASVKGMAERLWPPAGSSVQIGDLDICGGFVVGWASDMAEYLLRAEAAWQTEVEWSARGRDIIYSAMRDCHWYGSHLGSEVVIPLPFRPFVAVAMSRMGLIAGRLPSGRIAILGQDFGVLHTLTRGYEPAWSNDGKYLFYLSRVCGRVRHYRVVHPNRKIATSFCSARVIRVRANGTGRTVVTWQSAYGFAHLNVLSDDETVVFTRIPNEYRLWRHRADLKASSYAKYCPRMDIEIATLGGKPRILIKNAHLPEVQPELSK